MFSDPGKTFFHRALKNKEGSPVIIGIIYYWLLTMPAYPCEEGFLRAAFCLPLRILPETYCSM